MSMNLYSRLDDSPLRVHDTSFCCKYFLHSPPTPDNSNSLIIIILYLHYRRFLYAHRDAVQRLASLEAEDSSGSRDARSFVERPACLHSPRG